MFIRKPMTRHFFKLALLCASLAIYIPHVQAQSLQLGFYNVENLFDTINSPDCNDGEFTPSGTKNWSADRYRHKMQLLAEVIRAMECDIIGICEVENESVVEELARLTGYDFVHLDTRDGRGMDQALMFRTERFEVERFSLQGNCRRAFLLVEGAADSIPLKIIVAHLPSKLSNRKVAKTAASELKAVIDSLSTDNCDLVVMGDLNVTPQESIVKKILKFDESEYDTNLMFNPFAKLSRRGEGSIVWNNRLKMYDQIVLSRTMLGGGGWNFNPNRNDADVFVLRGVIVQSGARRGYPQRSYIGNQYTKGPSDHLPVRLTLRIGN